MTNAFGLSPVVVATWMAAAVGIVLLGLLILAAFNRMLLRMALRNTVRRRGQTVLIVVGLMLATVIFTASLGVGDTLTYSVQADQLRLIGGIDEGFTRHGSDLELAGSKESDFFSDAQATDVIARSLSDPNVGAAAALVAVPGSVVDKTTSQTASMGVTVFGVADDFGRVWGPLRSRSGAILQISDLAPDEVYIGRALANRLNASAGDKLTVYVDGHLTEVRVRQVLDTDINRPPPFWFAPITYVFPSAAASSVLMPVALVRGAINHPSGYNLILLHNRGSGGVDDLGPGGVTGREIARRMHGAFTDREAAAEMKAYLSAPPMRAQLKKVAADLSLALYADATRALLVALERPQVDDDFVALLYDGSTAVVIRNAANRLINLPVGSAEWRVAQQDLEDRKASLKVDSGAANEMKALLDSAEIRNPLTQIAAELPPSDPAATTLNSLLLEARRAAVTPRFKAIVGDPKVQLELGMAIGTVAPAQQARFTEIASRLDLYVFSTYKADAIVNGQVIGFLASSILLTASLFAMAVGALLIFLIFVMLAAERRSEMGMSRALGLRRRDLIQCFMFEGTAYTLVASGVGVVVGVLVGRLMTFIMSGLFSTFPNPLALQYQVDWTSLAIAICLGILLTFAIVAFSAYKVSRLNIVAAIRDLDENEARDVSFSRMFTAVLGTAWFGVRQLIQGHPLVFLNRITLGMLGGIRTFWWALFRRGPLTVLLGTLLVAYAVGQEAVVAKDGIGGETNYWSPFIYGAGVSLVIVGAGLLIKWLFTLGGMRSVSAARVGFTVAALGLVIYWGRPLGQVEKLLHIQDALQVSKLRGGADVFVFSALMLLLGAIWLVIYNIEILIGVVTSVTGRIGSLAPVTRTSMAYPMASKFRTGMALALFALVTFTVVFMSIFKDTVTQNISLQGASLGGWHIVAGSTYVTFFQGSTTELPTDIAALVRADSQLHSEVRAAGWENNTVFVQTARADGTTSNAGLRVVDDVYLSNTGFAVKARAAGYASDRAAWDAIRDNVGFAIISFPEDKAAFEPYQLQLFTTDSQGNATKKSMTVTVIGYASTELWGGVFVSTRTALAGGFFTPSPADRQVPAGTPPRLATSQPPLTPTGYYFMLQPGVDAQKARRDVGRLLVNYQLEPVTVAELVNQPLRASAAIMSLITGFLALGLVVGIAGLGVISTRAVVERRQQIGMLRALGYRGSLVQRSFLMESSLIAIVGLIIGTTVGVWWAYRLLITDRVAEFYAFGGKALFHVPVVEIAGILVLGYLATLLTTYLPARAASRIAPAEALRYE